MAGCMTYQIAHYGPNDKENPIEVFCGQGEYCCIEPALYNSVGKLVDSVKNCVHAGWHEPNRIYRVYITPDIYHEFRILS